MLSRRCISASSPPRHTNRQRGFEMGVTAGSPLLGRSVPLAVRGGTGWCLGPWGRGLGAAALSKKLVETQFSIPQLLNLHLGYDM